MISIVIPAYNSGRYLSETVAGVQAQTVTDWELIIVDDGSTDGTAEQAAGWSRQDSRIRLLRQEHGGTNRARNLGLAHCHESTWAVVFLDHDDVWEPHALEILGRSLSSNPEAVAAYGSAGYIDGDGRAYGGDLEAWIRDRVEITERGPVAVAPGRKTGFGMMALGNRIPTPGQVLIRRRALEQVGGWDVAALSAADYVLWVRLSLLGDLLFLDRRVIGWRQHPGNLSKQRSLMELSSLGARQKLAGDQHLTSAQRRLMVEGYRLTQLSHARLRLDWARACVRRLDLITAAKQLRHAAIAYVRSVHGLSLPRSRGGGTSRGRPTDRSAKR